jgi:choline-sulfatase
VAEKPNVLVLLADEHSPLELGCNGARLVRTPHLDALAARGVNFDAAYCQAPMCVPSRLSFLSGKYSWRIGAWSNASSVPAGETSIPRFLGWHGYRTAAIGKLHFLGDEQFWGFQERPYGDFFGDSHQPDPLRVAPRHTLLPIGPTEIPEELLQEMIVTRLGIDFLRRQDNQQPFFLMLSYNHPHFPVCPPRRYWDEYFPDAGDRPDFGPNFPDRLHPWMRFHRRFYGIDRWTEQDFRRFRAGYRACVNFVDDQVGAVLGALDQAGLRENTIVLYFTDHGDMNGEHGMMRNGNFYDPSVRVPLIISYPGVLPEGTRVGEVAELTDVFPTIAELAGLPVPADIDGRGLARLMTAGESDGRKGFAISESYTHGVPGPMRMIRVGDWKLNLYLDAKPSLFNLREDPREFDDRIDDPGEAQRVARELEQLLRTDWDEERVRAIYKPVLTPAENQNRRPSRTPNQYLTPSGAYVDAETFSPPNVDWSIGAI